MKFAVTVLLLVAGVNLVSCDIQCSDGNYCPPADGDHAHYDECCRYFRGHCCTHEMNKRFKQIFIAVIVVSVVIFLILVACVASLVTCCCCAVCRHTSKTPTTHTILNTGYTPVPNDGIINNSNTTL